MDCLIGQASPIPYKKKAAHGAAFFIGYTARQRPIASGNTAFYLFTIGLRGTIQSLLIIILNNSVGYVYRLRSCCLLKYKKIHW